MCRIRRERAVDLGQRPCDLDGDVVEYGVAMRRTWTPATWRVVEERALARGDGEHALLDGQRHGRAGRQVTPAVAITSCG